MRKFKVWLGKKVTTVALWYMMRYMQRDRRKHRA